MKHTLFQRLTALLLVLSMTLSLSCTALATELVSTDTAMDAVADATLAETDNTVVEDASAEPTEEAFAEDTATEDVATVTTETVNDGSEEISEEVAPADEANEANEAVEEETSAEPTEEAEEEVVEAEPETSVVTAEDSAEDHLYYYDNLPFTGIAVKGDTTTLYYQGELLNGYYRETEADLLYTVTNGVKASLPFSGQFKAGMTSKSVTYSTYLYGTEATDTPTDPADPADQPTTDPADSSATGSTSLTAQEENLDTTTPDTTTATPDVPTETPDTTTTPDTPIETPDTPSETPDTPSGTPDTDPTAKHTVLTEGACDGLYYKDGDLYSGYMCQPNSGKVYQMTNGKAAGVNTKVADDAVVYNNNFNNWTLNTSFNGRYVIGGLVFTGFRRSTEGGNLYYMQDGLILGGSTYTGTMTKTAPYYVGWTKTGTGDGKYYQQGKLLTGVAYLTQSNGKAPDYFLYVKGAKSKASGFVTVVDPNNGAKKKLYYVKSGSAKNYAGKEGRNVYLKNNGQTFRYTFKENGEVVTDLFSYQTAYKKSKMKLYFARTYSSKKGISSSNMGTILLWDSAKKKYDIAAKSFVVGMSVNASDTKFGTYYLTSPRRWFEFTSPDTKLTSYMPYGFHIDGSGSLLHGSSYRKADVKTVIPHIYNQLGTNVSRYCVRTQVVNCKLIYDIAKQYSVSKRKSMMTVNLTKSSSNYKPFGQMTLLNNFDYNGYLYRGKLSGFGSYNKKEGYSFDPTDPAMKGQTVYIAPNKSTYSTKNCTAYKAG